MPKVSPGQTAFNAGELSPLVYARTDLAQYNAGLKTCIGFLPTIQGALTRSPGTYFAAEVKDSSKSTRLARFEFSVTQAYVLEFGDQYIRFYMDNGQIEDSGSPYEIESPYVEADLFDLNFAQSADVLYIAHPAYAPRKLSRTGHTSWDLSTIDFLDGPYLNTNTTAVTITPAASALTEFSNPKNFALNAIVHDGAQFVAVGAADGTDAYIVTSPDGVTWTERANPKNFALNGIEWNGSTFVAVGAADGTDAYIVTSPDGIVWTEQTNPKNFDLNAVCWDGGNDRFIAVGAADGTDAYIVTSPDGVTWTERANPKNFALKGVARGGSILWAVGVADGTDAYTVYSINGGTTWVEQTNPKNFDLNAVCWDGSQFVAVGAADGADAYVVTWNSGIMTERANPKNFALNAIAWNGAQMVAVGAADGTDAYVVTSAGGITWTERANPKNFALNAVAFSGVRETAVGAADGTDAYIVTELVRLIATGAIFSDTDIGRPVRLFISSAWGCAKIASYVSPWEVVAQEQVAFAANTATSLWRLGVWSDTTGWPGAVTFYEDRLVWGGPTIDPQRIDGSRSGNYENMAPTETDGSVTDSNAIAFTLNSGDVNVIRWMIDDEGGLLVGTSGGQWVVRASVNGEALSPTNVSAKRFTSFGAAAVQAVRAGRSPIFVQRERRTFREIAGTFEGYIANNMTLAAEHITAGGVVQLAYQAFPHGIVWSPRADGVLLGVTYSLAEGRDRPILGWHRRILGGSFGAGNAVVESVVCIPSADGTYDQLWLIVKRTINGATKRYVEYVTKTFDEGDAIEDAFFVDCGLTYSGVPADTISGLDHLEGQTVAILADGAVHPSQVVTGGQITLNYEASKVHVGLAYSSDGQTMRFDAGAADGTSLGKIQRIIRVTFRLLDTVGLKYGPDFDNLDELPLYSDLVAAGDPTPLFSGDETLEWPGDYGQDATVCFRQDKPLPCTVAAILPQLTTEDRG